MSPSIRKSIMRMVAANFPQLVYGFPRTYRVAAVRADKTIDLVPLEDAQHLAEIDAVEAWGLGLVTPTEGAEVVVMFRDANPARPMVIGWAHGSPHEEVDLGESPYLGVARLTDEVQAGPFAGVIVQASTTIKAGT